MANAKGTATVDFGSTPSTHATVAVTGQASLGSGSAVGAWIDGTTATADHSADEHVVEPLQVTVTNKVAGTGFTIEVACLVGATTGQYSVTWAWAD